MPAAAKFENGNGGTSLAKALSDGKQPQEEKLNGTPINSKESPDIQKAQCGPVDPDACKDDKNKALYQWEPRYNYSNNPGRPGRFNYTGRTRPGVNYGPQAHHSWPKVLGGDPNQRLVTIIESIHQSEIHYGFSPVGSPVIAAIGSIYAFLTNYINSSTSFGPSGSNVLQGRPLNHTGSSGSSNQLLIDAMQAGTATAARLKGTVRQGLTNYYTAFATASNPAMPYGQYRDGIDDSYNHI